MRAIWILKIRNRYFELWKELEGWKLFLFYAIHYTVLFMMLARLVFMPFFRAEKGFIWNDNDGMAQHFMRICYISQTLREGIRSLLSGEGWSIPVYDFHSGLSVQDLQIGFPQILAIFCPEGKTDVFYK